MIKTENGLELVKLLNGVDESTDLEAKAISGDNLGKSVFETICALSNEPGLHGGTLLLGVEREQALFPNYKVIGVADPDKLTLDLQSSCSSVFNHPIRPTITPYQIGDHVVLKVDVGELQSAQKPLYFKSVGTPAGAFRRVGSSDVRCTDEDIAGFYIGQSKAAYDASIVEDADWADLDSVAIDSYRADRAAAHAGAEELGWSDSDMLRSLNAVRRIDDHLKVTVAGLLMFGTAASLRRLFPTIRVDYIRVPSNKWVADPDQHFESLDMRGSIVTIIPRIIAAITDDLPKTLNMDDNVSGQREETAVLPIRVIREAVVNALMHRSYEVHEPIQIIRYSNRLEIKNPGYSLKSEELFDDPGSVIRNPAIAAVLHETRFAETKGSGIRVMNEKMKKSGLSAPTFESDRDGRKFTATFLFHHFLQEADWKWLEQFSEFSLNEEQMKALVFVREVGAINNSAYRAQTETDTLTASKSLRKLVEEGLLVDRGKGAKTYYIAGPKMLELQNMDGTEALSIHAKDLSMDARSIRSTVVPDISQLPEPLRQRVRLATMKKRLSPHETTSLIAQLCNWKPLSTSEIANYLNKGPSYIGQNFVSAMISSGELEYTYPELPSHPDQKYTAKELKSPTSD